MEPSRKEQIFIVSTVAVLLLGGVAFGVAQFFWMGQPAPLPMAVISSSPRAMPGSPLATAAPAPALDAAATERFMKVYRPDDNQALKRIPPPFIAERDPYFRNIYASRGRGASTSPPTPGSIMFRWTANQMALYTMSTAQTRPVTSIVSILGVRPGQYDIAPEILSSAITGDWVVRTEATEAQKMEALGPILSTALNKKIRFEKQKSERDAIVISGTYAFTPLPDAPDKTSLHIVADKFDAGTSDNFGSVPPSAIIDLLTQFTALPIVNEGQISATTPIPVRLHQSGQITRLPPGAERDAQLELLLGSLSKQTGMSFTKAQRSMDVWKAIVE